MMRSSLQLSVLVALFTLGACFSSGPGPEEVASSFWKAASEGDAETVEALSLPSESAKLNLDSEQRPESVKLGELTMTSAGAEVETFIVANAQGSDDLSMELSFDTVMVERDGKWLVDLDETTNRMMQEMFGGSLEALGEAMGQAMAEGMEEAMKGMADGMAEAMKDFGESMEEATDSAQADEGR